MKGYHGRILEVDLSERKLTDLPLPEEFLKKYIGGATLAAALVYDHLNKATSTLASENPLVFSTGPFTGTPLPMVSRYAVGGISPLTGFWGEATSGGKFPFRLKGSGWDGLLVKGKADKPAYLFLKDGKAEIRDAAHLWGKDSYQTQKAIKDEVGDEALSIACIAATGEKRIKYASIMNDNGRAAGRCGLGALMGAKNLKAVAASGNLRPEMSNPEKVRELAKQAVAQINGNLVSVAFREYGTMMYMDMAMTLGDAPAKYFSKAVFPVSKVTGQALRQTYTVNNYACLGCPIGCGRELKEFRPGLTVDGPEYETAVAFGPLCLNTDLDSIVRANHLCNTHGIDTISTGVSVAYAFYLYELGVLNKSKVGLELKWGDGEAVVKLVEMIIAQEGIGKILSQGTLAMAKEFGRSTDEAAQVKGLEMPMHDGRAFHGMALSYATGPRGACHLKGDYYNVDLGNMVLEYMILPSERLSSEGKSAGAAKYQSLKDLFDSLALCKFAPLTPTQLCEMLNAITGWQFDPKELLAAGERSINLKRAVSNKLGLTREQDKIPKICSTALDEGSTAGIEPDMEKMLREYYQFRGWDWETGRPTKEKLLELELNQVAADMYP
ncbi:MAG: aldehyde ferredoxin oxidoreductase family protein [Deltaproteobacteria bacterium]|nr:aldehyde ferredoxin oxidoreductase family protein [Deltaproteobacteria bacterium]